jgi:HEAT repeat protein
MNSTEGEDTMESTVEWMKAHRDVVGLIRVLGCQESAEIRQRAARALGELGNPSPLEPLLSVKTSSDNVDWNVPTPEEIGIERAVGPLIAVLADKNEKVRCAAIDALAQIGDGRSIEPLIGLLADENKEVRNTAIKALGQMGDARAVQPLNAIFGEHPYVVANALSEIGSSAVEPLVTALGDSSKDVRCAAAWALGKIGDLATVPPLVAALRNIDRETAFSAAAALRQIVILTVKPLIQAFEYHQDIPVAAEEIAKWMGTSEITDLLMVMLRTYTERCLVLGGQISDPVSLIWIGDACRNLDHALRGAVSAAYALGAIGEKKAVHPLIAASKSEDSPLRRAAAWALGQIRESRATEALVATLKDDEGEVRRTAAEALDQMGWQIEQDEDAGWYWLAKQTWKKPNAPKADFMTAVFCNLLKDDNERLRYEVVNALGEMGNSRAVEPLIRVSLEDKDEDVRRAAVRALGKIGSTAAVEALIALIKNDDFMAWQAAQALGKISDLCAVESLLALLQAGNSSVIGVNTEAANQSFWRMNILRVNIAYCIGEIGDKSAIPALENALRKYKKVKNVCDEIESALFKLGVSKEEIKQIKQVEK